MPVFLGAVLFLAGVLLMISALPVTHRLVRMMPQWRFTTGDTDRLASTTFLVGFVGALAAVAGALIMLMAP